MNKRKNVIFNIILVMVMGISVLSLNACNLFESSSNKYAIYYSYNNEQIWSCSVRNGDSYTISFIPEAEFGYSFDGWYDSPTGGTKLTSADGKSIVPFSGRDRLNIYPQFVPNQYTVKLDYGGASATSDATITAVYGQTLPQLPIGLIITGKNFSGWYTKADCKGTQVSAADGVAQIIFNQSNFAFNKTDFILYAGFTAQMRTVTFRTEMGTLIKEMNVEYGSPLIDVANSVRVDGMGVLSWRGDISGNVTKNIELIALEYAPVIELDCCGGQGVSAVIAQAGSTVVLPTPEKEANDFLYWADESGKKFTSTVMPEDGISLKAVWQPKIVFDSNGGNEINEIVKPTGTSVTLPFPTRSGYLFAGWYTKDEELFDGKTMPAEGAALKAGWYKEKTANKVIIPSTKDYCPWSSQIELRNALTIDLSDLLPEDFHGMIKIQGDVKLRHQDAKLSSPYIMTLAFYNDKVINKNTELMATKEYSVTSSKYEKYKFSFEGYLISNKIYGAGSSQFMANTLLGMTHYGYYSDMNVSLIYADTSMLYL